MKNIKTILILSLLTILCLPLARSADINFVEKFALGGDRKAALKLLIPGTTNYYYYHGYK